jgi:hypothetical protein
MQPTTRSERRLEIAAETVVSIRAVQRALKRAAAQRRRERRQIYAAGLNGLRKSLACRAHPPGA